MRGKKREGPKGLPPVKVYGIEDVPQEIVQNGDADDGTVFLFAPPGMKCCSVGDVTYMVQGGSVRARREHVAALVTLHGFRDR